MLSKVRKATASPWETGAVTAAPDSYTYRLAGIGDGSAAAAAILNGGAAPQGNFTGDAGDNTITGTAGADYFDLSQGGNDNVFGLGGDDAFFFGAAFTGNDQVDGGAGTNDQIGIQGDYTGANRLVLGAGTIANVEVIVALPGFSYDITMNDGNVAAGGLLKLQSTQLAAGQSFRFDGSAEHDGSFALYGGPGNDTLIGGDKDDSFFFGPGQLNSADFIDGGGGANDQISLKGDFNGSNKLVLGASTIANIEGIVLVSGNGLSEYSYDITMNDGNVAPGGVLKVQAQRFYPLNLTFDGSAEHDGSFLIYAGGGDNKLIGGSGNDGFAFFGRMNVRDSVDGGPGDNDQLALGGEFGSVVGNRGPFVIDGDGNITNIEVIVLLPYDLASGNQSSFLLSTSDALVPSGATMPIFGLQVTAEINFDGSHEHDGAFRIYGGLGADTLSGGAGNDWIFGGLGALDTLTGGGGNDTFYYDDVAQSTASATDRISDFASGDKIDISGIDAVPGGGDDTFAFLGSGAFTHHAGELRATNTSGSSWRVEADTNGDGTADLVITVTVSDSHPITAADFVL